MFAKLFGLFWQILNSERNYIKLGSCVNMVSLVLNKEANNEALMNPKRVEIGSNQHFAASRSPLCQKCNSIGRDTVDKSW